MVPVSVMWISFSTLKVSPRASAAPAAAPSHSACSGLAPRVIAFCVVSEAALPKNPRFVTAAPSHSGAPAATIAFVRPPQAMLSPMLLAS